MNRSGWQQTWVRILTTVLTLCMMAVIFALSGQDSERSDYTSGFISKAIIPVLYRDYALQTPEKQQEIYDNVQYAVRKCAHFTEYTVLGILIRLCLESWFGCRIKKRYILLLSAFVCGAMYAGTDEWHQRMIDGRSGQWTDVLLDSFGVLFGTFAGNRLIDTVEKRKKGPVKESGNECCTGQSGNSPEYR